MHSNLKLALILGTRPEIVKLSPIIRQCSQDNLDFFVLHTGQHYSYLMDKVFFEQLELPNAKYNLDVGSGSHGQQTGKMIMGIEEVLQKEHPDVVLVQGDTNTVLAGAIAATKLGIKVGHVEAGLRSYDPTMPEETNRVLADHCSDYLFPPTEKSAQILLKEGIAKENIFMVGNTVVDSVNQNLSIANSKADALERLGLMDRRFILVTSHRQENVDNKQRFSNLIEGLKLVQQELDIPLIYPIHPRARKQLQIFDIDTSGLNLIEPLDYLSFLQLEGHAQLILTDSGGVQEEACILGVPCVTLRENTERPETIDVGANILAGTDSNRILKAAKLISYQNKQWINPFGDGTASKKIIQILNDHMT
jgi:UDP-N-acetylglucosamine 2-epimerase (non-hydrolysing)